MGQSGKLQVHYSRRGLPTYSIEIWHDGLAIKQHSVITGRNRQDVEARARKRLAEWDKAYLSETNEERALSATNEAHQALNSLETILSSGLGASKSFEWKALYDTSDYATPSPKEQPTPAKGCLATILPSARLKYEEQVKQQKAQYHMELEGWEEGRKQFLKERDEHNQRIDSIGAGYSRKEPTSIEDFCTLVLEASEYPHWFPKSFEINFNPANGIVIVDYQLPSPDSLPSLKEVRYVKARREFVQKEIPAPQKEGLYDDVLYQTALRSIHELYQADTANVLSSVVFNGYVQSVDPATGSPIRPCVLSLQANMEEFAQINLGNIEPKACFRRLKGVSSSKLHSLAPVPPVLIFNRQDSRFIQPKEVVDRLAEGENLAAMDWEDFEHLIREIFEKEFAAGGGEVKVTRASRDWGVDAIAFDPDPIRGGKIVIQAKRYTNTVGVDAVRDLYGTVINEGASKGILVTTAEYGPESYQFAKGKPITLLTGGNLLSLLEKHGHKARIDLNEAKRILGESERR